MGKTIQTIATILDHRPKLQHARPGTKHNPTACDLDERRDEEGLWDVATSDWNDEMDLLKLPKKFRSLPRGEDSRRAGTLVICPVIALSQWRTEIEKFTEGGGAERVHLPRAGQGGSDPEGDNEEVRRRPHDVSG